MKTTLSKREDEQQRLDEIIRIGYHILCNKIACKSIVVDNEAALQLQYSVILKTLGQLYEFAPDDRFSIELEKKIKLDINTSKCPKGNARCDIWLTLGEATAAVELKFFKKSQIGETSTMNRFNFLCDIENLEHYREKYESLQGYAVLFTNNSNYCDPNTTSYINIGEGVTLQDKDIESNGKHVYLKNDYTFHWDRKQNQEEEYNFLLVQCPPTFR